MATYNLFTGTRQLTPEADGAVTLGCEFEVNTACNLTGLRYLHPVGGNTSPRVMGVYDKGTGTLVAGPLTMPAPISGAWCAANLPTPVQIAPGNYRVACFHPTGDYAATPQYFDHDTQGSVDTVIGPITRLSYFSAGGVQGSYSYGSTLQNPTNSGAGANYWADVIVTDAADPEPEPVVPNSRILTATGWVDAITKTITAGSGQVTDGATLQRIPWEGGPEYYTDYPQATASGMTDPTFFPLLVDYESVTTQADIDADRSYGVNGYYRLTEDSDMGLIRDNGMIAFAGPTIPGVGDETVGWNVDDEVDMWGGAGWREWDGNYPGQGPDPSPYNFGYDVMAVLTDPAGPQGPMVADGRMKHMNYGKGLVFWTNDEEGSIFTNGGTNPDNPSKTFALDAVSADLYFYSDNNTIDEATTWLGIPRGEIRRAYNYGKHVVDRVRTLQQAAGIYQPVYGFVECSSQGANVPQSELTDAKIEGATWSCIIHEARGMIYFVHDFIWTGDYHNLRNNVGGHTAAVAQLNARITALAPVLNTQSYVWEFADDIDSMLKISDGQAYIFAMSMRQAVHDTGPRQMVMPTMIAGTTATVLHENRTVPIVGGILIDTFAEEHTCHIYRVDL